MSSASGDAAADRGIGADATAGEPRVRLRNLTAYGAGDFGLAVDIRLNKEDIWQLM